MLAACYAASASDVQLLGAAPGRKTDKLVRPVRLASSANEPLAEVGGVTRDASACAATCCAPPLARDRLTLEPDGRVRIALKAAWKDGTHAVLLDPLDLIARLCALVPPPRFHMLRYHGVLAAHSAVRAHVVPGREPPSPPTQLPLFEASEAPLEPPRGTHGRGFCDASSASRSPSVPCPTAAEACASSTSLPRPTTSSASSANHPPARSRAPPPPPVSPAQLRLVFA